MTVPATGLFIAPCSRKAADFACRAWHYSKCLPSGRCLFWGIWFDGIFEGSVIASRGSCANIHKPFNLRGQDRVAEVTRVSLRPGHLAIVSQVLAIVVRLLRRTNPDLECLISYADQRQGHHGGIYQAAGWTYLGETGREALLLVHGRETHARTISSKFGRRDLAWLKSTIDPNARRIDCPPKYKYALGLTSAMRERLGQMAQPYPKSPVLERDRSIEAMRAGPQAGEITPSTPAAGTTRERAGANSDPVAPIPISEHA